jgi:hypothetical protein
MTDKQYLQKVLELQKLEQDSDELTAVQDHRADVEKLLRDHFEKSSPTIKYGGSIAKGTLVKESYDLDVICYFENDDTDAGETLKDIYYNVKEALQDDYLIDEKASALRLKNNDPDELGQDFHIDVVPGRYIDDTKGDTFLYQVSGEKSRLKTNLDVHIEHVKNSEVIDAIRLFKLWRKRNGVQVKNFALELSVIELLKEKKDSPLADQLKHVWTEFRDNIDALTIKDPANPEGNDLSELLSDAVRSSLTYTASSTLQTLDTDGWTAVFGEVEDDEEAKVQNLQKAAAAVHTPSKPWSWVE